MNELSYCRSQEQRGNQYQKRGKAWICQRCGSRYLRRAAGGYRHLRQGEAFRTAGQGGRLHYRLGRYRGYRRGQYPGELQFSQTKRRMQKKIARKYYLQSLNDTSECIFE